MGEASEALFLLKEGQQADPDDLSEEQANGVRLQMQELIKDLAEMPAAKT